MLTLGLVVPVSFVKRERKSAAETILIFPCRYSLEKHVP
jgi:hypothetical protein